MREGLSQADLSFPGCSVAYVSRIENGERVPSLQVLRELAQRLGVSERYLALGEDEGPDARLLEAEVALRLDDLEVAETLFRQALAEAERGTDRARALAGLGQLAWRRDDNDLTIRLLEEALELFGDGWSEHPEVGDTLGRAYTTVPELERSISIFERYLAAAKTQGDFFDEVRFSVLLANALMDNGNLARAAELLAATLTSVADSRDPFVLARVYWTQSRLHEHQGDHEAAARHARRALELLQATDHAEYIGQAHQLLAYIEVERGNAEEALALARRSRELMRSASELDLVEATTIEARALTLLGEHDEAAALAMRAAGLLSRLHPAKAGRNYAVLAGIFEELGERERARELYELAIDLLEPHWSSFFADVCARYAEILEDEGRTDEALDVLKRAVRSQAAQAGRR